MSASHDPTPRYEFGPLERRGIFGGLTTAQVLTLLAGGAVAVAILDVWRSGIGALAAGAVLALVGAAALVPAGGRSLLGWSGVATVWSWARLRGRHRWESAHPLLGHPGDGELAPLPPPTLAGATIIAAPYAGVAGGAGVIRDGDTYTAVLVAEGAAFALEDQAARARMIGRWSEVLAALGQSGGPVDRIQWVERAAPEDGDAIARYLVEAIELPRGHSAVESYIQLTAEAGPVTASHVVLVAVRISWASAGRQIVRRGGGDGGACDVLMDEVTSLGMQLNDMGLPVRGIVRPRELAALLREGFEPDVKQEAQRRALVAEDMAGLQAASAWPLRTETGWSSYRAQGWHHATFWVREFPRLEVGPDWLSPLIYQARCRRSIALVMQPVPALAAERRLLSARTADEVDQAERTRHGFVIPIRRLREQQQVLRREAELAAGHAMYRFSGYITVSAPDPDELELACSEIRQKAARARQELERLVGMQDLAFTFTLPLCRGVGR
jgi:hypothetical protein